MHYSIVFVSIIYNTIIGAMSFFKNIFGGGSSNKPDPKLQQKINNEKADFDRQKAVEKLQTNIDLMEHKVNAKQKEITDLETQIKTLIQQGKKDKAKIILKKVKARKDDVSKLITQQNFMQKQLFNLESTEQDKDMYEMLKETNKIQEANQQHTEKLTDELEKARELEQERKMNDDLFKDLMADDEDEDDLEDELAEYEQELGMEMNANFNNAQGLTTPGQQQQYQPQQQQAQKKTDDFDDLMAQVMN